MTTTPQLPRGVGVGFKPAHFGAILAEAPSVAFFEVHAENYMGAGGPPHRQLARLRSDYALSIHGVGLSIGSAEPLDRRHLARLRALCDRYEPQSFSEHLAWSSHGGAFLNDLLPLPYTRETLTRVVDNVDAVQNALGRRMLLENPATYVAFAQTELDETDFLAEVARRAGCGLLLDVNNVFVAAINLGFEAADYLSSFALEHVREIHLAGHFATRKEGGAPLLIDAHDSPVADPVWTLFAQAIGSAGPVSTLIEWDNDVPDWPRLASEARKAKNVFEASARLTAA